MQHRAADVGCRPFFRSRQQGTLNPLPTLNM
jgi:hypothetical protein